jgi:hypothetical protein
MAKQTQTRDMGLKTLFECYYIKSDRGKKNPYKSNITLSK